ncbi:hypothetical protein CFC35_39935 [Streptomyces sp. FBKL.4005]|nr:hypothetical protein CFC35_39935 [Streptomyces sp. FBKL.4005]
MGVRGEEDAGALGAVDGLHDTRRGQVGAADDAFEGGGGVGEGVGDGESGQGEFLELPDLVAALQLGVEAVDQRAAHPFEVAQQGDFAVGVHGAGDLAYADHFGCGQVGAAQGVQGQPAVADAEEEFVGVPQGEAGAVGRGERGGEFLGGAAQDGGVLADQHPDAGAVRGGRLGGGLVGHGGSSPNGVCVSSSKAGPPRAAVGQRSSGVWCGSPVPVVRSSCRGDGPSRISMPARR